MFYFSIQENEIVDDHVDDRLFHHEIVDRHHQDDSMLFFKFMINEKLDKS